MTAQRRSALGRGLGALIPSAQTARTPDARTESSADAQPRESRTRPDAEIPVAAISPNPQQPRREFAEEELDALAHSLRRHGFLQPVVVRRKPGSEDRYELVVGERRFRAAQRAGIERIPATIKDVATPELLEVALVENVQRQDLNPMELAHAFHSLLDAGATQEEVGQRVGLDRSSVANHVRLLELSRELQTDIEAGRVSLGHAKALLALPAEKRRALRDEIVTGGLSVRGAEERARRAAAGSPAAARRKPRRAGLDPDTASLVDQLRARFQTQVRIRGNARRGAIELEYYGPEELHRLVTALLDGR